MAVDRAEAISLPLIEVQSNPGSSEQRVAPRIRRLGSMSADEHERFPMYGKFKLERSLRHELSSILESGNFSDLREFAVRLSPIAHAVIERQDEDPGRPSFHYEVAFMMIYDFLDKHEALYERESQRSFFKVVMHANSASSDGMAESLLYLLATLFVLAGPLIFTRPKTLKLLSHVLGSTPTGRSDRLDELRTLTLQCLIWSFSRMIKWDVVADSTWQNATQAIKPHLNVDDIPHLVAYLVGQQRLPDSSDNEFPGVKLASMVVYNITKNRQDNHSRVVAFDTLRQLLLGGCSEAWPGASITLDWFLRFEGLVNNTPIEQRHEPECGQTILPHLSMDEINASWDYLASSWHGFVQKEINDATRNRIEDIDLSYELVEMWRVLLHTGGREPAFLEGLRNAHVSLIFNLNRQRGESLQVMTPQSYVQAIHAVLQLWLVATNELDIIERTAVAEMVLRRLFEWRDVYTTFTERTEEVWNKLIEELVFCDPMKALTALEAIRVGGDGRRLVQQQIWCDLVHFVVIPDVVRRRIRTNFSVAELVAFLRFPYKMEFQHMDNYAHLLWDTLLSKSRPVAQERRKFAMVLELIEEVGEVLGVENINIERENWVDDSRTSPDKRRIKWMGRGRRTRAERFLPQ